MNSKITKSQFVLQMLLKDESGCTYDNLQIPIYNSGVPGSGKSHTLKIVYLNPSWSITLATNRFKYGKIVKIKPNFC